MVDQDSFQNLIAVVPDGAAAAGGAGDAAAAGAAGGSSYVYEVFLLLRLDGVVDHYSKKEEK